MPDASSSAFQRKLAEKRAREAAEKAKNSPQPSGWEAYADLIPTVDDVHERSADQKALDTAVEGIDIIAAYRRWCGKMEPVVGKKRESIMISCPKPNHKDSNPSAWINLDKQTWFCGSCQEGGDSHDIAAYHYGYPVPQYKNDATFHKLREQMAKDFGFTIQKMPGGVTHVIAPEPEPEEEPTPTPTGPVVVGPEPTVPELAPVIEMTDDGDLPSYDYPSLDWRSIVPENSFIRMYMRQCIVDDIAEEYHFWNALVAVGFALGREARLFDSRPVYGNLFVCTLGHSGSGKSKAAGYLNNVLDEALPHDWTDPSSRGVRRIATPGSAEVLIHSFQKQVTDPSDPKKVMYHAPVKGLIDFNEFSQLMGRAGRQGNMLKPTLMQFYDMDNLITSNSLTTGSKEAHDPFASILTTTQPAAMRELVGKGDDNSGFLNRWVFVAGPDKKKVSIGGAKIDISPSVPYLQAIFAWAGQFRDNEYVELGPEAYEEWDKAFHEVVYPKKIGSSSSILNRLDLLMKKLILLLAGNKMERVVSGQTVREAMSLFDYILKCYEMPESELGKTLNSEVQEAVLYQCRKQWEKNPQAGVTVSIIARNLARRNYPREMIVKTLDTLVKLDLIEPVVSEPGKRGRPTTRYRYVG
jgi:hypothetical protein